LSACSLPWQGIDAIEACNRRCDELPLEPGLGPEPVPWTRADVDVFTAKAQAWADLAGTRRTWDALRREWQPPHG
jgi:hypothetical protein